MINWKENLIKQVENNTNLDEVRKIFSDSCKSNCRAINFNYSCPRCVLIKHLNKVV